MGTTTPTYTQMILRPWHVRVSGGADGSIDPPVIDPPVIDPPVIDPPTGDEPLGEAGKRALEAERRDRKAAEARAAQLERDLAEARKGQMTAEEKAIADAKDAGRAEALAAVNARLIAAEVKAAATGKVVDPSIVSSLIDLSTFQVDASGNVDGKAITSAIDALLADRPYLAAVPSKPPVPGAGDGGPKGSPAQGQLTQADLVRMRREGRDDDIAKAFRDGRFKDLQGA